MLTASNLIARQKAVIRADNERMARRPQDCPRAAWRMENPIDHVRIAVRDMTAKSRPRRKLAFDLNGSATDLWVWSIGKAPRVVERIDLANPDADARLARYQEA